MKTVISAYCLLCFIPAIIGYEVPLPLLGIALVLCPVPFWMEKINL